MIRSEVAIAVSQLDRQLHQIWRLQHYVARGFTVGEISWEQIGAGAFKSSQVIEPCSYWLMGMFQASLVHDDGNI